MVRRSPFPALLAGAVVAGIVLGGCQDLAQSGHTSEPEDTRDLLIFVFDRSNSVQEHELTQARQLTRDRVNELEHGDRIVALELLEESLDEEPRRWSQRVPNRQFENQEIRRDSVARARFIQDVRDYIVRFSDPEDRGGISGTDILSTLHLVASEIQAYPEYRPTLFLYSDMLQANRVMNMEGLVRMPPDNWVQTQAERGTLPDLEGLCVVIVGARNDTRASQIIKDFWVEYFEATGATLQNGNYNYRPVRLPERPCPGR